MVKPMDELLQGTLAHGDMDQNALAALIVSIVLQKPVLLNLPAKKKTPLFGIQGHRLQDIIKRIGTELLDCSSPRVVQCFMGMTWDQLVDQMVDEVTDSIPHIVFINCIDHSPYRIQALFLSSINRRRINRGNGVTYPFPDMFLLVAANSGDGELLEHLKDGFLMSYEVTKQTLALGDDGDYAYTTDEKLEAVQNDMSSVQDKALKSTEDETGSVIGPESSSLTSTADRPRANLETLTFIRSRLPLVTITADIRRYMENIVVFIRTHRLVRKGVSPRAVKDFENLVRALCVLHEYEFATPTLVAMAARIVLPLKLTLCEPSQEPTITYGGDVHLIRQWMDKWDVDLVIEDVLSRVPPPM